MDYKLRTFKEIVDSANNLGIPVFNKEGVITICVYDAEGGEYLLPETQVSCFRALRLFGHLTIYNMEIVNDTMLFVLNPPDTPKGENS